MFHRESEALSGFHFFLAFGISLFFSMFVVLSRQFVPPFAEGLRRGWIDYLFFFGSLGEGGGGECAEGPASGPFEHPTQVMDEAAAPPPSSSSLCLMPHLARPRPKYFHTVDYSHKDVSVNLCMAWRIFFYNIECHPPFPPTTGRKLVRDIS